MPILNLDYLMKMRDELSSMTAYIAKCQDRLIELSEKMERANYSNHIGTQTNDVFDDHPDGLYCETCGRSRSKDERYYHKRAESLHGDDEVVLYANPTKAIPHHDMYPKMKIAVQSYNDQRDGRLLKFLVPITCTDAELHQLVRDKQKLPGDEPLYLTKVTYEMIRPDDRTLWAYNIRYFPTYISRIPYDQEQGDLMITNYAYKGDNINGDPAKVRSEPSGNSGRV